MAMGTADTLFSSGQHSSCSRRHNVTQHDCTQPVTKRVYHDRQVQRYKLCRLLHNHHLQNVGQESDHIVLANLLSPHNDYVSSLGVEPRRNYEYLPLSASVLS